MKFSFMQNPLTQIQFYAWIYNSFINSHLLEWLKVRQIKSGKGNSEDEGRWILYSIFSGSWKFISIKIWNARFTIVLVLLLSNRDSIYCLYSVVNVGLVFTEAHPGSTLTALCFEITEKNLVNTSNHLNKFGGN